MSFVGSSPIAKYVYEKGIQNGKRVQSAGGAKNYVFVLPDADMANTAGGLNDAAFGCAGQRCMAGSTAVLIGKAADRLINPLREIVSKIQVGPTDRGSGGTMGAVIARPIEIVLGSFWRVAFVTRGGASY